MSTRLAATLLALLLASACATPAVPPPTATSLPPTATAAPTSTPAPTPTATPLGCLSQPGRLEDGVLETTKPPQQYKIYLPPCYDEKINQRYPVLYLLHGQTYTDDQWVRLGAATLADQMILAGEAPPFIIVFPDDRYWNLPPGPEFGGRLVNSLIPYIDATYRTLGDRSHRALGGLSRGGGWTVQLGFTRPDLFGSLGLHSPAVFQKDDHLVVDWVEAIPAGTFPRIWLDVGDQDKELGAVRLLESTLSEADVPHEFHLYSGDHSENYWRLHVEEYLRWYVSAWTQNAN